MTTASMRAAERLGYLLATRPRLRRAATIWVTSHMLALWSVAAAPPALASTMAGALTWTGIADSHGVPLGAYYLSVVSTSEAITEGGPDLSVNPTSWIRWFGHAVTTAISHDTVATLLQAQASIYIFMITLALWLLRFAMSSTWLSWLATWFRPLFDVMRKVLTDLWVFPICLVAALGVGAHHILWHGHRGRGWGIMLSSFAIGLIGLVLTRDPLTDLYGDNGLLNQGRNLGFTVAQAAMNNGATAPGGANAQMQNLTGLIADATVRAPLQVQNFGTTVDGIGTCANAWSAAILTGAPDAPAHAMANCGAPQALAFAQHLNGNNVALGAFFILIGCVFTFFVCYVTYSYVMVAGAAFFNAFLALFAAAPAMIAGHPRRRAARRLRQFFKHGVLVFAYVTYISVAAVIVLKTAAPGGYAAQVNMTHPVALLVMIALVSAVATGLFWWLKRELGDHTRQNLTHNISEIVRHGRSGYQRGQHANNRGKNPSNSGRKRFGPDDDNPAADADTGRGPDGPLTGPPAPGRPPGGYRPDPNRGRRPPNAPGGPPPGRPQTPPAQPQAPAAQAAPTGARAGAAAGAGEAAEAGAAVVAPEVVIGAAVAGEAARRMHTRRHHTNGDQPAHQSTTSEPAGARRDADTQPEPTPSPAPGRAAAATAPRHTEAPKRRRPGDPGIDTLLDDSTAEPPTPGRTSPPRRGAHPGRGNPNT